MDRYKPWNALVPCFCLWVVALFSVLALPGCGGYSTPQGGGGGGTPDFFLFTANGGSGNTSAFLANGTSGALTAVAGSPFAAGGNPTSAAVDPAGKFLYVTNLISGDVSAIRSARLVAPR